MKRLLPAALLVSVVLALGATVPASAGEPTAPTVLGLTCQQMHDSADSLDYWLCGGKLGSAYGRTWGPDGATTPSWDGTPLDVDVTVPEQVLGAESPPNLPLMVMMHGWGGDKGEFESQTVGNSRPEINNWNNVAFVKRGYAVVNYTARGHHGSCGPSMASATPACAKGWTHLADQRFEIRDTQFLAGELADAGLVNPQKIGVTGLSYGAGQSWQLAVQASQVATVPDVNTFSTYDNATFQDWVSPQHHYPMRIAVAVPHYGWSDLIDSLMPNGRAGDQAHLDGNRFNPIGIEKASYVAALFGGEASTIINYEPAPNCADPSAPTCDPSANLENWFAQINAGEPAYTSANPTLQQALNEIKDWKSAYYLDQMLVADKQQSATHYEVPILAMQGWTDQLFPEVEAQSMINKLRAVDPSWPVGLALSDIGHPIGQNKPGDWSYLNARGNSFADHYMLGTSGGNSTVTQAQVSNCAATAGGTVFSGSSLRALQTGSQSFTSSSARQTTALTGDETAGLQTDPVSTYAHNGGHSTCISLAPNSTVPGSQAWTFPVTSGFTLLGDPILRLKVAVSGTNAEIDTRLWDVAPDGTRTLVTRGAYRWTSATDTSNVTTQLFGNGWQFQCGHQVQLEVTQNDSPYLRPDDFPSAITYNSMSLTLPTAATATGCSAASTSGQNNQNSAGQNALPFTAAPAGAALPASALALLLVGAALILLPVWRERTS